jgi:hypothetical protein
MDIKSVSLLVHRNANRYSMERFVLIEGFLLLFHTVWSPLSEMLVEISEGAYLYSDPRVTSGL